MSLSTNSAFIYGFYIDSSNFYFDFSEDGGTTELTAELTLKDYSPETIADELALQMTEVGALTYTAAFNRTTRKSTISAGANFVVLPETGTHSGTSCASLFGFTEDTSAASSCESDTTAGEIWEPQFFLQDYIPFGYDIKAANATINQSANGEVEVVQWGSISCMSCTVEFITNKTLVDSPILNDGSGVSNALAFMNYAITKKLVQFIPDVATPSTYTNCILESSSGNTNGTGFILEEMIKQKLAGYFTLNKLKFREVTV
jgi:hypothetical protein